MPYNYSDSVCKEIGIGRFLRERPLRSVFFRSAGKPQDGEGMIHSMTGFGRAERHDQEAKIIVELRSVNHRYLDLTVKAPRKFSRFDAKIRALLKEYAVRGKLDVFITYEDYTEGRVRLLYNEDLAGQYVACAEKIAGKYGIPNDLNASRVLTLPDVLAMEENEFSEDELWNMLEGVVREAGEAFEAARRAEGVNLREDLMDKLQRLEEYVGRIEEREPAIMEEYRKRLEDKTKELLENAQIDESRIAAEVVLFADKICTDEETVRLKSHIRNMRKTLNSGTDIGRKLDFIAQEMNREANTILSKTNDIETSDIGVDMKTLIEKIREQVQNIE